MVVAVSGGGKGEKMGKDLIFLLTFAFSGASFHIAQQRKIIEGRKDIGTKRMIFDDLLNFSFWSITAILLPRFIFGWLFNSTFSALKNYYYHSSQQSVSILAVVMEVAVVLPALTSFLPSAKKKI